MKQKSFTLIELLVAVSIFITVVVISLATVVALTQNRTRAETNTSVQTSSNLVMEMIVSAVQNGGSYTFGSNSLTAGSKTFSLSNNAVLLTTSGLTQPITSPNVSVTNLTFTGVPDSSTVKGYVTIEITAASTHPASNEVPLTLHTTVISQL
jgi:type II secretory pathway pseudopilin PulG